MARDADADVLQLTAHCLLRLCIALALEAGGIDHGLPSAAADLNQRAGRRYTARRWLEILEPYYLRRFSPGDAAAGD